MNCPSCGSEIKIVPWITNYVCPYCGTISLFERDILKSTWEKSEIIPFPTTFEYGKIYFAVKSKDSNDMLWKYSVDWLNEKELNDKKIEEYLLKIYIFGHIRYHSEGSIYDKFFLRILSDKLELDRNKNLIAEEDEWQIKLYYIETLEDKWFFEELFNTNEPYKNGLFIQEKWIQEVEWFEWWIPFDVLNVKQSKYLNLVKKWWNNILIENYWNGNILFGEGI